MISSSDSGGLLYVRWLLMCIGNASLRDADELVSDIQWDTTITGSTLQATEYTKMSGTNSIL